MIGVFVCWSERYKNGESDRDAVGGGGEDSSRGPKKQWACTLCHLANTIDRSTMRSVATITVATCFGFGSKREKRYAVILPAAASDDDYHATLFDEMKTTTTTGNETVPKIIINNTINLFFETAIRILLISSHNSFRVLFDKIASVYFS